MIYDLIRYQVVDKSTLPRENVLLVSLGCSWGKCAFCDYQDDKSQSVLLCDKTNREVLDQVRGSEIGITTLEVTCSASYAELPFTTLNYIRDICIKKGFSTVILEGHYLYRETNHYFIDFFGEKGIKVMFRCGVETFDEHLREDILHKGLPGVSPENISRYFQWINLMYGMDGQTFEQLQKDISIGVKNFDRVNLSIYTPVKNGPKRDTEAIDKFYGSNFYKSILEDPKVDIYDEWDEKNTHKVGHDI
jgi:hypothetical protein